MAAAGLAIAEFPAALEASEPPEARGLARDAVRLLVSDVEHDAVFHARFRDLPDLLAPGDLLVVNASATINAALPAESAAGEVFELHLSTRLPGGFWSVELRGPGAAASLPDRARRAGLSLDLPGGGSAALLAPYPLDRDLSVPSRLWLAALTLPLPLHEYLDRHGFPIRYGYVPERWPLAAYQTMFATEPGSAEMPSAGRPFTPELVARLGARGIAIMPIVLHTGVASQEEHEPPYEEIYRVSPRTAARVNATRRAGHRVIAVGTTVVRALETVTDTFGTTHPGEGWTHLVIDGTHRLRSVTSMITGLHEPRATHLAMLERVLAAARRGRGRKPGDAWAAGHLRRAYQEARREGYRWHEFGDSHLILAPRPVWNAGRRR